MGKLQARLGRDLKLYVRQLAWLHATPKPPEGTKRAKYADKAPRLSRLDAMKRDGVTPKMPPNPAPHIIGWLVEMGLSEAAGMGSAPISWATINEWQRATRVALKPWEARLIHTLSVEYLAEGRKAESETCPAPWRAAPTQADRNAELARLQMVLG